MVHVRQGYCLFGQRYLQRRFSADRDRRRKPPPAWWRRQDAYGRRHAKERGAWLVGGYAGCNLGSPGGPDGRCGYRLFFPGARQAVWTARGKIGRLERNHEDRIPQLSYTLAFPRNESSRSNVFVCAITRIQRGAGLRLCQAPESGDTGEFRSDPGSARGLAWPDGGEPLE